MHNLFDSSRWLLISLVVVVQHLLTVTPVVGIVPEHHKFEPRPNAGEVDAIFDVPLEMFLKAGTQSLSTSFHWFIDSLLSAWASLSSALDAS